MKEVKNLAETIDQIVVIEGIKSLLDLKDSKENQIQTLRKSLELYYINDFQTLAEYLKLNDTSRLNTFIACLPSNIPQSLYLSTNNKLNPQHHNGLDNFVNLVEKETGKKVVIGLSNGWQQLNPSITEDAHKIIVNGYSNVAQMMKGYNEMKA